MIIIYENEIIVYGGIVKGAASASGMTASKN